MNERIHEILVDSLRQDQGYYCNNINANHPKPCSICQTNVTIHQKALSCASCSLMVHIKCNSTTLEEYIQIQEANDGLTDEEIQAKKWKCSKCLILNLAKKIPFGQQSNYELIHMINNDIMKALDNLPSYDIVSKASDFESLKQTDIDENIITNINSGYYPVHEFNKLNS